MAVQGFMRGFQCVEVVHVFRSSIEKTAEWDCHTCGTYMHEYTYGFVYVHGYVDIDHSIHLLLYIHTFVDRSVHR